MNDAVFLHKIRSMTIEINHVFSAVIFVNSIVGSANLKITILAFDRYGI